MLSTAIKAYQDTVRKCSAHSEQRLKVGVLEPSDVEKDFRLISRLGCAALAELSGDRQWLGMLIAVVDVALLERGLLCNPL